MFVEEILRTEITDSCDVLVCGGGFAGISAALAAARQHKKVMLLEKGYMLGGLGTAGLVTVYLPLCDGMGRQVSFGIAEELLRLSVSLGAEAMYPDNWLDGTGGKTEKDKRFEVQFNPALFAIFAEQLLLQEGVDILYGTYAVGTTVADGNITNVITENKSGRQAIAATSVVDATGDADIAAFSGAPTAKHTAGNILAAWYYELDNEGYRLNMVSSCNIPPEQAARRFSGLDGKELSEQTVLSHKSIINDILQKREQDSTVIPTAIATIPQVRMTRKIVGEYTLNDEEMHTYFEDSVGMVADWRKRGPVYEVPFRTLYSKEVKNLICAGRCTGVTDGMWDIMRVIPCCAVTGEAAGTAAAMTDDFPSLDVARLQAALRQNRVVLHECEL